MVGGLLKDPRLNSFYRKSPYTDERKTDTLLQKRPCVTSVLVFPSVRSRDRQGTGDHSDSVENPPV